MADENPALQDRRDFFLALPQAHPALEVIGFDSAHERPKVRNALVRGYMLVVAGVRGVARITNKVDTGRLGGRNGGFGSNSRVADLRVLLTSPQNSPLTSSRRFATRRSP